MDNARYTVTLDEFKLFHGIDRELYVILIRDLVRNPLECLYIIGMWLWLERVGFRHFISKILPLPAFLINELADEAVACITGLNKKFPFAAEATEIPLTQSLVKKDISLTFFYEQKPEVFLELEALVRTVCVPSLSDIMENGHYGSFVKNSTRSQMMAPSHAASTSSAIPVQEPFSIDTVLMQSLASLGIVTESPPSRGKARANETSRNDRTMFVTFSKGYPVSETEVRLFFTRLFGNCIESFHMQEVRPDEQSLYAKIVFVRATFIRSILNGVGKAKFTINGKHVWMRKFVPKTIRPPPCGCPSIGVCSCRFF